MIQEYIEFAIENGYSTKYNGLQSYSNDNDGCYEDVFEGEFLSNNRNYISLERLITSKEFIEAIARGLEKKMKWDKIVKQINKLQSDKNLKKILNKNTGEQLKVIKKYFG